MSRIHILSDQVANQIAAGEVVERPVGAVKELLENSLDAGSTRVEIEFRNGGKSYIRVEDNGCGMLPDEAMLSLERHATSKIRKAKDLEKVISFGFRGEALPSIASISRFTLRTRPHDQIEGTEILVNAGRIVHQKTCGMPPGTRIEAANLFYSVPARRKFLKTENTEAAHISRMAKLYAIAHPEVSFNVYSGPRKVFQSPACTDLRDRISEVFGNEVAENLTPLPEQEVDGCHLRGMVSPPGIGRPTRQDIVTVVNSRPVESRTLLYALTEGYHTLIPKGKYPVAFLFLDIDPAQIDVNVHPQKREIRFHSEGQVRRLVIESILKMAEQTHPSSILPESEDPMPLPIIPESPATFVRTSIQPPGPTPKSPDSHGQTKGSDNLPDSSGQTPEIPRTTLNVVATHTDASSAHWRLIGRLQQHLALFETTSGMIILHLQAARERIRFEEILNHGENGKSPSQELLLPVPVQLDNLSSELLEQHGEVLRDEGFSLELFGRDFYRIEAIPPWLEPGEAENFLRQFIELARENGNLLRKPGLAREELARLAVLEIATADDTLSESEVATLPDRLLNCRQPLTCPQGKATFYEVTSQELAKKFGRKIP